VAKNDFFLSFGSDAGEFSRKLASDLDPGIDKIYRLAQALQDYEERADSVKGGQSPLGSILSELDTASAKFDKLGSSLAREFGKMAESMSTLGNDLQDILAKINKAEAVADAAAKKGAGRGPAPTAPPPAAAPTKRGAYELDPEYEAWKKRQQSPAPARNATKVSDDDMSAAWVTRVGDNMKKIKQDSIDARNALKRVSDINATLAGNATTLADNLKILGRNLREVIQISNDKGRGLEKLANQREAASVGNFQGSVSGEVSIGNTTANPVPVMIVGEANGNMAGHHGHHASVKADPVAAQNEAAVAGAQAAQAEVLKRGRRILSNSELDDAATPGGYYVGGVGKSNFRTVGQRINPGETFNEYFARYAQNQQAEKDIRQYARGKSIDEHGERTASMYEKIQNSFSSESIMRTLEPRLRDAIGNSKSVIPTETITTALAQAIPHSALTKMQRENIPAAFADYRARQSNEEFARAEFVRNKLAENEHETFAGSSRKTQDMVRYFDENASNPGPGTIRRQHIGYVQDEQALDRAARNSARADLERPGREETVGGRRYYVPGGYDVIGEGRGHSSLLDKSAAFIADVNDQHRRLAPANDRATAVGVASARHANAQQILSELDVLNPNAIDSKKFADLNKRLKGALSTIFNDADQAIQRGERRIQSLQAKNAELGPDDDQERNKNLRYITNAQRRIAEAQGVKQQFTPARRGSLADVQGVAQALVERRAQELAKAVVDSPREEVVEEVPAAAPRKQRTGKAKAASRAAEQVVVAEASPQVQAAQRKQVEANDRVSESVRRLDAEITDFKQTISEINSLINTARHSGADTEDLHGQKAYLESERDRAIKERTALSGGGGGKPPKPPKRPTGGSDSEPADDDNRAARSKRSAYDAGTAPGIQQAIGLLSEETRALLENTKAQLANATAEERRALIARAGAAFKQDPLYSQISGRSAPQTRRNILASALGLTGKDRAAVGSALTGGRDADIYALANGAKGASVAGASSDIAAVKARTDISDQMKQALLREMEAQQRLDRVRANSKSTDEQLIAAERALMSAHSGVAAAQEKDAPKTTQQKLFGQKGFAENQLRHIGLGVENIVGYSLVFTGFEKLRELVHTGIEADAVFVRLQTSLAATGRATGTLRTQLQGISSGTATPLEHVIEAASELTGVFSNNADLAFGTKIAAQLANISQGTLTAKEAAIGLRDVTDAYGISGTQKIQAVGDMIARLSQVTGVSVKDITEGTTQLAQEARDFGLNQRQAAVLSAYVTKATGETGQNSAEQVSRLLSTLYNGKVQDTLTRVGVATKEQFQKGDIAGVLTNLMQQFDHLNPSVQQTIASLVGSGRQARAFAALMHDGAAAVKEFNNSQADTGALGKQNQAYLQTIAGTIKQLDEDFQGLGNTLTRIGAFDFLGALAKSLDLLLKTFNGTFGRIADFMDKNPITKGFMHMTVAILEAAAALRLFGGAAATGLGRLGILKPLNAVEVAAGEAPIYGRLGARRAARGAMAAGGLGAEEAIAGTGFFSRFRSGTNEARVLGGYDAGANGITRYGRVLADSEAKFASLGTRIESVGTRLTGLSAALADTGGRLRSAVGGPGAALLAGFAVVSGVIAGNNINNQNKNKRQDALSIATGNDLTPDAISKIQGDAKVDTSFVHQLLTGKGRDLGKVSGKSRRQLNALSDKSSTALQAALDNGDPKAIAAAESAIDSDIVKQAGDISRAGGNDDGAQAKVLAQLAQLRASLKDKADMRLKVVQAGSEIDALNQQQISDLSNFLSGTSGFNKETLSTFSDAFLTDFQNTGAPANSTAGRAALAAIGMTTDRMKVPTGPLASDITKTTDVPRVDAAATNNSRLTGARDALKILIDQETIDLHDPAKFGDQKSDAYLKAKQQRDTNEQQYQQYQQQLRQNPITVAQTASSVSETTGAYSAAASQLSGAVTNLEAWNKTLDQTDPQYWANVKQIQDIKTKIAELLATPAIQAAELTVANTVDPVRKAAAQLQLAQAQLQAAGSDAGKQHQAQLGIAQANIGGAQAQQGLTEAQIQAQNAGIRNSAAKAQADLNAILQQEGVYSSGSLKDDTHLAQLQAQETQARASIRDAVQADAQAVFDAVSALQKLHGNDVGAAKAALTKAQQAYAYAVQEFGSSSAQAQSALAQVFQAQADLSTQALTLVNSKLDLEIAQLNARGQAGDAERAAQDEVKKAQNALNAYRARGGQSGTAESNKLLADLATARRNAFDTALQAQLDTLDFQRETYKITSSQEVQALQQILKNKELTLKEQRDITLKIKNLQQSIRDQLTNGGLNIPSDIKLPTAYEVRRSLGAGFGGTGTTVSTVNNNQRTNVQINNNVPTAQVAAQIANQVIGILNQQTGQQVRANSSTPRLVPTR